MIACARVCVGVCEGVCTFGSVFGSVLWACACCSCDVCGCARVARSCAFSLSASLPCSLWSHAPIRPFPTFARFPEYDIRMHRILVLQRVWVSASAVLAGATATPTTATPKTLAPTPAPTTLLPTGKLNYICTHTHITHTHTRVRAHAHHAHITHALRRHHANRARTDTGMLESR